MQNYIFLGITVIIELIFCPLFLKYQRPGKNHKSRTCKMITATMYIFQGLLCMQIANNKSEFAFFMFLGLCAGWIGDLFIHINDKPVFFIIGALGFFAGHILYIAAYIKGQRLLSEGTPIITMNEMKYVTCVLLILFAVIVKSGMELKKHVIVGIALYGTMIVTMCVKSVSLSIQYYSASNPDSLYFMIVLISGAVLFVLSDFSIVFLTFGEKYKKNIPLKNFNIWTYFIGQSLLASSILFLK